MEWKDKGYLLSKNQFGENSAIADFFSEKNGKVTGLIYGATSKKLKSYLQIGNNFTINFNSKAEGRIGYLKVEIEEILTPIFFENKKKLACVISAMGLIKLLTVEFQENIKIYNLIENFFENLHSNDWLRKFIFWELDFLKLIGYDLQLKTIVNKEISNGEIIYFVKKNNEKKFVPNFLIDSNIIESDISNLLKGLKLVGDYLDKSILKPNNLSFPRTRSDFVSTIKL